MPCLPMLPTLCITRRLGQELVATTTSGEQVRVRVGWIKGDRVGLAIEADRSVAVHRRELLERDAALAQRHGSAPGPLNPPAGVPLVALSPEQCDAVRAAAPAPGTAPGASPGADPRVARVGAALRSAASGLRAAREEHTKGAVLDASA